MAAGGPAWGLCFAGAAAVLPSRGGGLAEARLAGFLGAGIGRCAGGGAVLLPLWRHGLSVAGGLLARFRQGPRGLCAAGQTPISRSSARGPAPTGTLSLPGPARVELCGWPRKTQKKKGEAGCASVSPHH